VRPSRTTSTLHMRLLHTPIGRYSVSFRYPVDLTLHSDSTPFREWYNIPEAETIVRGTLRYQGFPAFIKALVDIGFLDDAKKDYISQGSKITWAELTAKAVGAASADEP
jgi:saccharopine dehydrogenase-like NADP-dependent oxidoreductase